jgi:hypothetical protein
MPAALLLASAVMTSATLTPKTEFAKPTGPMVVRLSDVDQPCKLVLLDKDAAELGRATAPAGDIDLTVLFPKIREAGGVVRVQAVVAGSPEGPSLACRWRSFASGPASSRRSCRPIMVSMKRCSMWWGPDCTRVSA